VIVLVLIACAGATPSPDPQQPSPYEPPEVPPKIIGVEEPPPPEPGSELVEAAIAEAETHIGTPYRWGGRNTETHPGLDCLGIMYVAYGEASDTPWKDYSVFPSRWVKSSKLGDPVPGLDGALASQLEKNLLKRGDVLYFLTKGFVLDDEPLLTVGEDKYWPWHTGIYWGNGQVLHAAPGWGVTKEPLDNITFDALFATRPYPTHRPG
jgi:cell wall-associated NlpC family hydrolase